MHRLLTGSLRVEYLTLAIANLPASLDGIRLVQLSDLHYDGMRLSDRLLAEAIAETNHAKPDLIFLTGDYVTDDPKPIHRLVWHLKLLRSQAGIYAVLGNHDYHYPDSQGMITEAFTKIGIQVLSNQVVYPLGYQLAVIGLPDIYSGQFNPESVMDLVDQMTPRIVLSHSPDTAELLKKWRIDLQLSGHTHGGQIVLPGIGPLPGWMQEVQRQLPQSLKFLVPLKSGCKKVFKHWEWASGLHSVGANFLYVNRGLGTYPPGRFNCPPEVTVITLKSS
ncbi:calcineurin-like phosphoesterase family protein [Lyngbya aestuarii BL J]|uniref:Calcineurin-like phosphoesterase family protein n=1 Tax=Lyngbya aestuarii BL J TaxID=1348334 RepID=U7QD08_9CYAN|nr:metallophosphoesterase [Lyngbya aestuarii]ERT05728.1 calcineurin-like phosphoesterase family protein [Lyngbya aestuarii BL J]